MTNKTEHIIDDDRLQGVLIDSETIHTRIVSLAQEIKDAYAGEKSVCLMGVLKGASIFVSDLIRELRSVGMRGLRLDFVRASTYQSGMKGAGEKTRKVKISGMTCDNVEGKSGVVTYGELQEPWNIKVGDKVRAGGFIGRVTPVLRPEKYRPDIRNHSVAMLHLELRTETCHLDGWRLDGERDKRLLDPTPYLKSKDLIIT